MINGGLLALLTIHGFNGGLLLRGDHRLGGTVTGTNINKRGQQIKYNAQAHDVVAHDVNGSVCGSFNLNEVHCI